MIQKIHLTNFRLFSDLKLSTSNSLVILSGKNATGKTSILEAIYICATSKSHRTTSLETVILKEKEYSICEIETEKKYKMVLTKEGKKLFINQKEISKLSEYIGKLNVVLFSPYDLRLIQGSKGDRRRFLDLEISLLDKTYLQASTAYKKLLHERNEALKSTTVDMKYLDVLTKQLIEYIKIIHQKRVHFLTKLNEILKIVCENLEIENIELNYLPTYEKDLYASFKSKERLDILTKVTNIGPHRDDFSILINGLEANSYASEGQIRTICIALKLSLKELITQITNKEPILLLDDVFAALDKKRIEKVTKYVQNTKQTFITTTSILEIPDELLKNALVLRIESKKGD